MATAVSKWQELKLRGGLDEVEQEEEEDIYSEARMEQVVGGVRLQGGAEEHLHTDKGVVEGHVHRWVGQVHMYIEACIR